MSQSLISFDTDRIKQYVFATGTLAEIRGASSLLDRLNREDIPTIAGDSDGDKIYANGGGGLFIAPTKQQDETIIQAVKKKYQDETSAATITGVSLELSPDFDKHSDLRPHWQRLSFKLRAAKDCNPPQANLITHPFLRPCKSCGTYYATQFSEPGIEPVILLCPSCVAKRNEDRSIKVEISKLITGKIQPNRNRLWHRLISDLKEAGYPFEEILSRAEDDSIRPKDLDTLGNQSKPGGYLGFIFADGDDMGRRMEEIRSLAEMERFSRTVDESIYGAVKKAILSHLQPDSGAVSLPFDILLLGGDDLAMVTTAQAAIETALTVMRNFSELTKQEYGQPLSLSVAVVLAHVKFPIDSLRKLAESALTFAKTERAERRLEEGLLNFLVVSSPNHLDFKEYHKVVLTDDSRNDEILYRTLRPYTADDMDKLIQVRRDLADVSRSKLMQLRSAMFKNRFQSQLDSLVAWSRWRNKKHKQAIQKLLNEFAGNQTILFPWVQREERNGNYYTPLLDLIELFDFIPPMEATNDANRSN